MAASNSSRWLFSSAASGATLAGNFTTQLFDRAPLYVSAVQVTQVVLVGVSAATVNVVSLRSNILPPSGVSASDGTPVLAALPVNGATTVVWTSEGAALPTPVAPWKVNGVIDWSLYDAELGTAINCSSCVIEAYITTVPWKR